MKEYVCPKCKTKVIVGEGEKLKSIFCLNCLKKNELNMLRIIAFEHTLFSDE